MPMREKYLMRRIFYPGDRGALTDAVAVFLVVKIPSVIKGDAALQVMK